MAADNLLYMKTITPITSGDKRQGVLVFFAKGVTVEELNRKGDKYTLTCDDIYKHSISAKAEWDGSTHGFIPVLGIN